ncbi:MAG: T9SS type A sorting domain-containing protein [Ignavibacteriaceae bacterium]
MKNIYILFLLLLFAPINLFAQVEQIALPGEKITSLAFINYDNQTQIFAGTESNGFYSHIISNPDSEWHHGWFNNRSVSTLFVQKVGHGQGSLSRIFFGMGMTSSADSTLIYTNDAPIQSAIVQRDSGIDKNRANKITSFAAFDYTGNEPARSAFCIDEAGGINKLDLNQWTKIYPHSLASTFHVLHTSDPVLWAGGTAGDYVASSLIMKSTNYGTTWQKFYPSAGSGCFSIAAYPGDTAVVYAGLSDGVIKSSDGGYTWEKTLEDSGVVFTSIIINPEDGANIFAGGKRSDEVFVLYKTNNNGETWEIIDPEWDCFCIVPGINTMAGIIIDNKYNIFIGTDGGGILKYVENVVSVNEDSYKPDGFYLHQNYPNPFNPETYIEFQTAETGTITVKIYDVLGKEAATLVNEEKPAGLYKIHFNAAGLSSGIYYYTLSAGEKVLTKKMVLIK